MESDAPLARLLLRAFRWMDDGMRIQLAKEGFPDLLHSQSLLIGALGQAGSRPSELAKRLGVSRQSVNQIVRQLEEMGMVELKSDPTSRRARLVTLTAKGRKSVLAAKRAFQARESSLAGKIGSKNVRILREILNAFPQDQPSRVQRKGKPMTETCCHT
jgi:DNA-binding MarR family transcriptional regulator